MSTQVLALNEEAVCRDLQDLLPLARQLCVDLHDTCKSEDTLAPVVESYRTKRLLAIAAHRGSPSIPLHAPAPEPSRGGPKLDEAPTPTGVSTQA